MLHVGIFVAVNAFVWAQDFALGGGLDYALWVTVPWAIALLAHLGFYMSSDRRREPVETRQLQHH
jgi:hypothetical protein